MEDIEGPRYQPTTITVQTTDGQQVQATTSLVKKNAQGLWTSKDYVEHIVTGLRQNDAPPEHVEHVITTAIQTNEQAKRRADEESCGISTLRLPL